MPIKYNCSIGTFITTTFSLKRSDVRLKDNGPSKTLTDVFVSYFASKSVNYSPHRELNKRECSGQFMSYVSSRQATCQQVLDDNHEASVDFVIHVHCIIVQGWLEKKSPLPLPTKQNPTIQIMSNCWF